MSFNENDLYTIAVGLVKETGFEASFEGRVIDLLKALQHRDVEQMSAVLVGDEELKSDITDAASLALIKAQTAVEENILANGSAIEIENLNNLKESQLNMINSL
ncbi:MAG: hypothetical protein OEX81_04480 [Candidatus Pacebacteria bacterium]|nr:hypothetical protein [Candidatus Paceibacterota bacterium]